ncbi:MAG: hypothetical protein ABJZ99_00120, partial [Lentilitoribacter sp.]
GAFDWSQLDDPIERFKFLERYAAVYGNSESATGTLALTSNQTHLCSNKECVHRHIAATRTPIL